MNREQGRAVVLTAIMVVSVFGMGFAFAGSAAASDVDRNDAPGGEVEQGNTTEVLDFNLTSEDQVLDSSRPDTGNDGDVEPGDELDSLFPGNYSYVDDNNNEEYDADETLIFDGNGTGPLNDAVANDEFDNQSEVIRYTEGAFRPYFFGENVFFTDVDNDTPNVNTRGNYTGEGGNYTNMSYVKHEAILQTDFEQVTDTWEIDEDTEVLTTGQANLTAFPTDAATDEGKLYLRDADGQTGPGEADFTPSDDDFLYVNNEGEQAYDANSADTIVAGPDPGGDTSNTLGIGAAGDLGESLFFLDFSQDGEFDVDEGEGSEPIVRLTADENIGDTTTGDALPNTAKFVDPADGTGSTDGGLADNYYEQYDTQGAVESEEGADDRDGDSETTDTGLQGMNSVDTLFLDDGAPDQDYSGEDGEDEDVVQNDLDASFPLVDGEQENFKGEDLGPDYDGTVGDQPVIRGQGDSADGSDLGNTYDTGLNLYEEASGNEGEPDGYEELVLVNEVPDCDSEGSDAYAPGEGCEVTVKYGDALVDLTVANTATADEESDLDGANLYRENDSVSGPSEGDDLVQSTTFDTSASTGGGVSEGGQFVFGGDDFSLNEVFGNGTTNDSAQFYVTVGIQDSADTGETLQFGIPQFRDEDDNDELDIEPDPDDEDIDDTGLFLESDEDSSTGPITTSDGDKVADTRYYDGDGPIVTENTQTIVSDESGPAPGEITTSDQGFGSVDVGDSTTRTVSVLNEGGQSVQVDSTTINGADAGDFAVTSGGAPFTLAPGENKEVTVEFAPSSDGAKNADLDIATANANSVSAALTGTAETDGGNEGPADKDTLTIEGTGPETDYKISVTDDLEKSDASSINTNDNINRGYAANGEVGSGSDSYTFNGTLETIKVDADNANVYVNGNELTNEEINNRPDRVIEFQGTGPRANYDFATNGDEAIQKTTANNANINGNDDTYRTTGYGVTGDYRDAFGFDGSLQTIDAPDSVEVYVQGKLANQDAFRDNVITIVGTGSAAQYDMTVESDLLKSTANYANLNANDDVSGDSATGEVGTASDSFIYNGDISEFSVDGDVTVFVDGELIDQGDVESEA
jgi:surface glycoprotein (TIGR04207 family)